ncbi:transposase [Nocardioides sp.]|uniref:transposase n=1 Tax=Nocardioides sp. TaxID=35761 RepID=UPI001A2BAAB9|nr:transposase [Nocardioides sp.]MBJ7359903.1 transposase [Nocardioides sp.]
MRVAVLTVDQRGSTKAGATDRVPATLSGLDGLDALRLLRPFERTAGDEFQGVVDDPLTAAAVLERLLRENAWNIGLGVGEVDDPLPRSTRAGRGAAYVHARAAVTAAKSSPWHLRVEGDRPRVRWLETTIWLWASILSRRTPRGWEVADLADDGLRYDQVAERLGITQSAVSQRAQAAGIVEGRRARELAADLLAELLAGDGA